MPELIVVTGPPGSGKTTVSSVLAGMYERSARVAGDDFFGFIDRGFVAPWTPAAHGQNEIVISAAAAAAGRLAAGGYVVIYDGVVGPWFVDVFGRAAGVSQLHYAVLLPAARVCVQRVESRIGHGFTNVDAARHMHAQFLAATLSSRHVIAKNGDATEIATDLRQLVQDGLILRSIEPSS